MTRTLPPSASPASTTAKLRLYTFAAALVFSLRANAAPRELTLDDALALAAQNNANLQSARSRVDIAFANVKQAWAALLPQLAAQGKYTHNYREVTLDFSSQGRLATAQLRATQDSVNDLYARTGSPPPPNVMADLGELNAAATQSAMTGLGGPIVIQKQEQLDGTLTLTMPLIVPSAYPALGAAKSSRSAAAADYAAMRAAILFSAAQAFFLAAGADEIVSARESAIAVARRTLKDAENRLLAGTTNAVEQQRAEIALVRAEQALDDAHYARDQSYRALATVIELREPFRVHPASWSPLQPRSSHSDVAAALRLRPEVLALEHATRSGRSQILAAKLRWAPSISGFGNLRAFNYTGFAGDNYAWAVGLQLDWLLYDGGIRDAQRWISAAEVRDTEARLRLQQETVVDEVANAEQALGTRQRSLVAAQRSAGLARQTLVLVRLQQGAGTATQLDLLTAQDSLVASELQVAQARFELSLARLTLERVTGRFPKPTEL